MENANAAAANQGVPAPWAKPAEVAPETAVTSSPEPVETAPEVAKAAAPTAAETATVTVTVPKAFTLRLDHQREIKVAAGVQQMEVTNANHWYSKANGVTIYNPQGE